MEISHPNHEYPRDTIALEESRIMSVHAMNGQPQILVNRCSRRVIDQWSWQHRSANSNTGEGYKEWRESRAISRVTMKVKGGHPTEGSS